MKNPKTPEISIVVPLFNEAETFPKFFEKLAENVEKICVPAEFIFVDDGSTDETFSKISEKIAKLGNAKILKFEKNRGKEAAIFAGISNARGNAIAVLDGDLQDPPELLPEMFSAISNENFDSAGTIRTLENENFFRRNFVKIFYKFLSKILGKKIPSGARDFRFMKREIVEKILAFPCEFRFTKGFYAVFGGRTKWFTFPKIERAAGTSKWKFFHLAKYCAVAVCCCWKLRFRERD